MLRDVSTFSAACKVAIAIEVYTGVGDAPFRLSFTISAKKQ